MARSAPPTVPARRRRKAPPPVPGAFDFAEMCRKVGIGHTLGQEIVTLGPERGGIESIAIGRPGSKRPRRWFTDAHVRDYLERCGVPSTALDQPARRRRAS